MDTPSVVDVSPTGRFGDGKWKIGISTLLVAFLYTFAAMWARTNENAFPSAEPGLVVGLVQGTAYLVGSYATAYLNGGFVFWSMILAVFVINWLIRASRTGFAYVDRNTMQTGRLIASPTAFGTPFVTNISGWDFLIYSVACILGSYLGGLFVWWIVGAGVVPFPEFEAAQYSPGPFPGLDSNFTARAATAEGFTALFIGALHLYFMLINEPRKGSIAGAISVFLFTILAFNSSGGSFDIVHWTMSHFASATAGNTLFPGADAWWWVYLIPVGGYFLAYGLAILMTFFREYTDVPVHTIGGAIAPTFRVSKRQPHVASAMGGASGFPVAAPLVSAPLMASTRRA